MKRTRRHVSSDRRAGCQKRRPCTTRRGGGTHVMWAVLHCRQPSLGAGLNTQPSAARWVSL